MRLVRLPCSEVSPPRLRLLGWRLSRLLVVVTEVVPEALLTLLALRLLSRAPEEVRLVRRLVADVVTTLVVVSVGL